MKKEYNNDRITQSLSPRFLTEEERGKRRNMTIRPIRPKKTLSQYIKDQLQ